MTIPTTSHPLSACCGRIAIERAKYEVEIDPNSKLPVRLKGGGNKKRKVGTYMYCPSCGSECEIRGEAELVDYSSLDPGPPAHRKTLTYGRQLKVEDVLHNKLVASLEAFPERQPMFLSSGSWTKYDGLWQRSGEPDVKLTSAELLDKHGDDAVMVFE